MGIEWAWLRHTATTAPTPDKLRLKGAARCSVFLLHGLTGGPSELAYVAHYLKRRAELDVWCPPLLNHGQPIGVLARTRWRELYASVTGQFDEARRIASANGAPLVVGGLSIGAVLALMLAAKFPADVAGIICLSPTLFYDGWNVPWTHRLIPLVDFTPLKYFTYQREEAPYGLRDEALRARVAQEYENTSLQNEGEPNHGYAHYPIRLMCEMHHLISECLNVLPYVTAPILIVQAENDDATSPRNAALIYERVGSLRKELLLLRDSFHMVTVDLERAKVASAMAAFCRSLVPVSPVSGIRPLNQ